MIAIFVQSKTNVNMNSFFRQILASALGTVVGLVISSIIMLFIVIAIIAGVMASFSGDTGPVEVKSGSVLKITLNKEIQERENSNPFAAFNSPFSGMDESAMGLLELRKVLEKAAKDENISGVYLELGGMQSGMATTSEFRTAIKQFKESGKFVVAYGETMSENDYYLASVADEVYLNPAGIFEFNGFFTEILFFKGTLEKLGVKAMEFRTGEYKSAIESFIREDMSEANREQVLAFLNTIYTKYINDLSEEREIPSETLRMLTDSLVFCSAEKATQHKLIDGALYYNEVEKIIKGKLGDDAEEVNFVSYARYKKGLNPGSKDGGRIAVIFATGSIVSGKGNEFSDLMGSDAIAKQLRKVREDDDVKAVVLRINSPGGSALASDVMWKEIELTREKKPVIASMSDLAASGGYYIAMGCDKIVAHENTLTGSIGVFYLLFNMQELLNDKLGMTTDGVKIGEYCDFGNPAREMTEAEKIMIQQQVEDIYNVFLTKAAKGRGMEYNELKALAGGRIWSGKDAKKNGLVDAFGGLDDAVAMAAEMAEMKEEDIKVEYVRPEAEGWQKWMKEIEGNVQDKLVEKYSADLYPYVKRMEYIQLFEGMQARMPFDLVIK